MRKIGFVLLTSLIASTAMAGGSLFGGHKTKTVNTNGVHSIGVHICGSLECPPVRILEGKCDQEHMSMHWGVCVCNKGYVPKDGKCETCPEGEFSDGIHACTNCAQRTYKVHEDDTSCVICPDEHATSCADITGQSTACEDGYEIKDGICVITPICEGGAQKIRKYYWTGDCCNQRESDYFCLEESVPPCIINNEIKQSCIDDWNNNEGYGWRDEETGEWICEEMDTTYNRCCQNENDSQSCCESMTYSGCNWNSITNEGCWDYDNTTMGCCITNGYSWDSDNNVCCEGGTATPYCCQAASKSWVDVACCMTTLDTDGSCCDGRKDTPICCEANGDKWDTENGFCCNGRNDTATCCEHYIFNIYLGKDEDGRGVWTPDGICCPSLFWDGNVCCGTGPDYDASASKKCCLIEMKEEVCRDMYPSLF